ncbi:hypothetical protein PLICRDRAFT_36029 [Plicaturopsis crispa FD-325 SS-3]|nr:hypothetical protein PLICRDRAFT_36029 [Plicaturopsis crispa FD-325 SS-3]
MIPRAGKRVKPAVILDFLVPNLIPCRSLHSRPEDTSIADTLRSKRPAAPYTPLPLHSPDSPTIQRSLDAHIRRFARNESLGPDPQVERYNACAKRLSQALKEQNVDAAWEAWEALGQMNFHRFLGYPQLSTYSTLLVDLCPLGDPHQPWDDPKRTAVEEIALRAAAARAVQGLRACMVLHLQRGNPDAVLELYARWQELLNEREDVEAPAKPENGEEDQSEDDFPSIEVEDTPTRPNAAIMLAVLGAYAMKNSFELALSECSNVGLRQHHWSTTEFLRFFHHDPPFQQKFKAYVERLETAGLVLRPGSLARQVSNLSRDGSIKTLEKLYASFVDGISGPAAYLTTLPGPAVPGKPIIVSDNTWGSFMTAFLKCRRFDMAQKLWEDMIQAGVTPGPFIWTAMFEGYNSIGAVKEALSSWNTMLAQRVTPSPLAHRALLSTLFRGQRPEDAMVRFQHFQADWRKHHPPGDDSETQAVYESEVLAVYNTVLNCLLNISRDAAANAIMQDMRNNGPTPDIVTYNTFIKCHARRANFKSLSVTLQELVDAGLKGDVVTFSTILAALLKAGRKDATEMVFGLMGRQGIEPNVATFSAMIDQFMRSKDENSMRGAFDVLRKMENTPGTEPNVITYTSILSGLYRQNWLDKETADDCAQYIRNQMRLRKIVPTRATYNILIKACLQNPGQAGLQNALSLYREMSSHIGLTDISWHVLLQGLVRRREWTLANEIVRDMQKSGHQPQGALADLMVRTRKEMSRQSRDGYS